MKTKMVRVVYAAFLLMFFAGNIYSQVGINTDGSSPDSSAMLDVASFDKGVLFPRLTESERNSLPSPAKGLLIYNTTSNHFDYYTGNEWYQVETTAVIFSTGTVRPGGGVSIRSGPGAVPDSSAMLDVNDASRGVLIPRTTCDSITSPAKGLIIYNTSTNFINYYDGNNWKGICASSTGATGDNGSQVATGVVINTTGALIDQSAILDVSAISKGILVPRLTETQRNALSPVAGLTIYNLTSDALEFFDGSGWFQMRINNIESPVQGIHLADLTQVVWIWQQVMGATGYKWNNTNNYLTAIDLSLDTLLTETGLTCSTLYLRYVWAYDSCGPSSATTMVQNTLDCPAPPTVNTTGFAAITRTTATCEGNVTSEGTSAVTDRGVCWSFLPDPTISGSHTTDGSGTGIFVSNLAGLTPDTLYYVRAYATNSVGTAYGNQLSFTTLGSCATLLDIRDSSTYNTVQIGTQCWMAQNLSTGTEISYWDLQTDNGIIERYWWPDTYGGLYTQGEAMDYNITGGAQGICPEGWHVPATAEWTTLTSFLGGESVAGGKMKEAGTSNWWSPNTGATNSSGFTALPGGRWHFDYFSMPPEPIFSGQGWSGNFWASSTDVYIWLYYNSGGTEVQSSYFQDALSVRCIKDTITTIPTVTTSAVTNITNITATCGGNVTYYGGSGITARGVCWSTLPNPTTAGNHTSDGNGTGAFISSLAGLIPDTIYYIRAYATNSTGTAYGNEVSFTTLTNSSCGVPIIDTRDGKTYPTVQIGTQCWLAQYLNVGAMIIGSADQTNNNIIEKYCYADNDAYCVIYGGMYQWDEVMNYTTSGSACPSGKQGICPVGWHVPSDAELDTLRTYCGGEGEAGGKLKETGTSHWASPNSGATNIYGFCGLPCGFRYNGGTYNSLSLYTNIQSSTENSSSDVWTYGMHYDNTTLARSPAAKTNGTSVRCVRDENPILFLPTVTTSAVTNIDQTTATGGGNVTSDGYSTVTDRGVCWSTLPNPAISDNHTIDGGGTGIYISNLTGLTLSTLYYVRAYATSFAGTAYGNEVSFSTADTNCGYPITIHHLVSGGVAPVDKTVNYGTVKNIPGEPFKCWITSNLGSDHQATAVNDTSEASAGWYWQFNRKQGYMHDGTTRTPNTTWTCFINENFEWLNGNDPCALELGPGWRIPTATEWENIDAAGNWTDWNGPWNSSLKIHAAGWLHSCNSNVNGRGSFGNYWSNNQGTMGTQYGWRLLFHNGASGLYEELKATGFSVRCLIIALPNPALSTVSTSEVINIGTNDAFSGGNVTSDGGTSVTSRGVCWSTSPNPTTAESHTTDGSGTGMFESHMTGLTLNTLYYVRAYSTNYAGTTYGIELMFTTALNPVLPTVTTNSVTNISSITATCGGNVMSDGGSALTARGVCWSTSSNPTPVGNFTSDGSETGPFVSNLTGLIPNTLYYVRAYATNSVGTAYGNQVTFTTLTIPTVTTNSIINITQTTATCGGNVTSGGGTTVSARGVCWSTISNPTPSDSHTTDGGGTGTFVSNLTSLIPNTLYYIRAYATNSVGTAFGEQLTFTTLSPILPVVITTDITNISQNTAISGGNVISEGYDPVTVRGVCWSLAPNPTTSDSHSSDGSGPGTFVSNLSSLTVNTLYYIRAFSTNNVGTSYGNQVTFTTLPNPFLPTVTTTAITYIANKTVSCGGNVTGDGYAPVTARGVCWSTSANPTITDSHTTDGSGTGSFISDITGLTPNTLYYIRAYATNYVGTSYGNEDSVVTLLMSGCGTFITINYIAGTIAPVNKTVTYETVTNIPGETTKCWITSNLGSDQKAITVDDSTEASAGWYWQFNHKQGFKHNGTIRTPNTTWVNYSGQQVDWEAANDPCTLGLDAGWRVPTMTEWVHVDASGNWTDWNGPWNSALKIHAAGRLLNTNGTLSNRGSVGYYWSSTRNYPYAWNFLFHSTSSILENTFWGMGFPLRCIRDQILPTVNTSAVTNVAQTTVTSGGVVTSDGGGPLTARGVCYGLSPDPAIAGSHTTDGSGTGAFVSNLTGLIPDTLYYIRAYAINNTGTAYGSQVTFSTLSEAPPSITTAAISNITLAAATSGGIVTSDGGSVVTARGVCWSLLSDPLTTDSHTTNGSGTGTFISYLTGLDPDTLYYVRAYAINSVGTAYGNQETFTTSVPLLPAITTAVVSNISRSTAQGGGNVSGDGGTSVTVRGICWSTSSNPTTANSQTANGNGTGTFTSNLTGLTQNTMYYVRAYATNSNGTAYGNQVTFTTLPDPVSPTVTTSVSNITPTTATSMGNVTSDGGTTVTARGICWSLSPNPTFADNHILNGSGTGTFAISLTSLNANTIYYIRAYASNSVGTAYGNQVTFMTLSLPLITTTAVTYTGSTTAICGGFVTSQPETMVTARGICWSNSSNPTTANNHTTDGSGTGIFVSNITSLTPNTLYYIRAYATDGIFIAYGNQITVTTLSLPVVTTASVSDTSTNSASCGGNVIIDGGTAVTIRGVCWNTSPNPTVSNNHTSNGSGTGQFTSELTGLSANTTYYIRAYATNTLGTAYGNEMSFTTLLNLVIPTLSTTTVTNIVATAASSGGNVTSAGGTIVTARGVCWSTSTDPTTSDNHITSGSGTGIYVSELTSLIKNTLYYVRAFATNSVGTAYGNQLTFTTLSPTLPTVTTTTITNITPTGATSGGDVTSDGYDPVTTRGVCWSLSPNPTIADSNTTNGSGTGTFTSNLTGLSLNTQYYIRAYATNSIGTAYGNEVGFSTLEWACGYPFIINHVTGSICPVNKTVTYGTVTNIPGETSKCWITGNLGADHQATAVDDAAEASAGWYWQFNHKQGFKHDGTTRTPNSTWVNYSGQQVDWEASNDPCALELDSGWRIPTRTEWLHVDASGSWTNWNGPWNSALKMHAAGRLLNTNGSLSYRGSKGYYWSSTRYYPYGWNLLFQSTSSILDYTFWGMGFTVRCVRDLIIPIVNTATITNIAQTTAASGGNITSDGGATVTARGICWSASPNPVITDSHTTDGNGKGTFVSNMTGLTPNTLYYARAYGTNNAGTGYGNQETFSTLNPVIPVITTAAVSNIGQSTATCGGNVTSDGYAAVTARGICWSTSSNPTTADSHTSNGSGTGTFSSNLGDLDQNTAYFVRAFATNSAGTAYGSEVTFTTLPNPVLPTVITTAVSSIGQNNATCGGNVTFDGYAPVTARGFCWSTSPDPTTAGNSITEGSGTGLFGSTLTGLSTNTQYYVRAYAINSAGTAYGNQVSFVTLVWSCGASLTINHVAGNVAPVTKTVTYGTVTNIPGAPTKCWITSNLGADFQATSITDASEPAAGWYWQFNRKQGYKHDGTTRTPSYWTNNINENQNWQVANDPCSLLLGNGWRLPTDIEWSNLKASGNWTDWLGPWNSGLKLHCAGYLSLENGGLGGRGWYARYWSSIQYGSTDGRNLFFYSYNGTIGTGGGTKARAQTIRCLNDSLPGIPVVTTSAVINITQTTATSGGNVTSEGGATVTARGVCWGTTTNPTIADSHTTDGSGAGTFVSNLTGLAANTLYYVRAYATNILGTAYGNEISFTTLTSSGCNALIVDARDGKTYTTVQIGTQCWMAQYLNIGTRINASVSQSNNSIIEKYCYNNDEANCTIYGGMYQWDEMMNYTPSSSSSPSGRQGMCPSGWHVPSDDELNTLRTYAGGENAAGGKLKEVGTSHWSGPNSGATNFYGFTALPCGFSYPGGSFNSLSNYTNVPSATETSTENAWKYGMHFDNTTVARGSVLKSTGTTVRCLKN